jgi:hypothetical protein
MISWSCNFAINKLAIINLMQFMKKNYDLDNCIFDINTFSTQWRL